MTVGRGFRGWRLTRREAMRLLGLGAGAGAVSTLHEDSELLAWLQRGSAGGQNLRFPRGAIIRTLLKDLPPEALSNGATLFHEHLSINIPPAPGARGGAGRQGAPAAPGQAPVGQPGAAPPAAGQPAPAAAGQPQAGQDAGRGGRQGGPPLPPVTDDVEMIIQLVNKAAGEGVACIVDGGHRDMGTKLADLKTIAAGRRFTSSRAAASTWSARIRRIWRQRAKTRSRMSWSREAARRALWGVR